MAKEIRDWADLEAFRQAIDDFEKRGKTLQGAVKRFPPEATAEVGKWWSGPTFDKFQQWLDGQMVQVATDLEKEYGKALKKLRTIAEKEEEVLRAKENRS